MTVQIPITNPLVKNMTGCALNWVSTTQFQILAGSCSNSSIVNTIVNGATLTLTSTTQGALGLDIGTIAASTMYAAYLVGDSTGYNTTTAVFSLSETQPLLPAGYDMYRKVGHVLTDGASHFLKFLQQGQSVDRTMWYDVAIVELNGGTSATYAAVDITSSVPTGATTVILQTSLTPTGAGDKVNIRPTGSTATDGYAVLSGAAAGVLQEINLTVPCSALGSIDYKVTGAVTLATQAYIETL